MEGKETVDACLFLTKYYAEKKDEAMSKKYAERLMEYHGPEREIAKDVVF